MLAAHGMTSRVSTGNQSHIQPVLIDFTGGKILLFAFGGTPRSTHGLEPHPYPMNHGCRLATVLCPTGKNGGGVAYI